MQHFKRVILVIIVALSALSAGADELAPDSIANTVDTLTASRPHRDIFHRIGDVFTGVFKAFNDLDTNYVEPMHYNYTVMLQNTNTYEVYSLMNDDEHSITFAPEMSYKLGPYVGWRWIFLGWALDLTHISAGTKSNNRKEFDLSLYSSLFGVDLFWRETGNNYKIRSLHLGKDINTDAIRNEDFGGVNSVIKGFNLYYVFNHKKFSYPAAYSQSTNQRHSAGTFIAGMGYTKHELNVDYKALHGLIGKKLGNTAASALDSAKFINQVNYTDFNISGGYAYNWVFAHNWLFDTSTQLSLAYKHSTTNQDKSQSELKHFNFRNFNLDGILRLALVYNNTKWFAGSSAILHAYNYSKKNFSTNNFFGSVNFYVGINLGRK